MIFFNLDFDFHGKRRKGLKNEEIKEKKHWWVEALGVEKPLIVCVREKEERERKEHKIIVFE